MLTNSIILPIIIAFTAALAIIGGECTGGNFLCSYFTKAQCASPDWDTWCTVNDNPLAFNSDCQGTIPCCELTGISAAWPRRRMSTEGARIPIAAKLLIQL